MQHVDAASEVIRVKTRLPILIALTASCCGVAFAQSDTSTATYHTPQGELVVHSGPAATRSFGAPPPFAQLDTSGKGFLDEAEAAAYPPLANDFRYADSNHDGRISRAEYSRWVGAR